MDKYERRRVKLLALRNRDFAQSDGALAKMVGMRASDVTRIFYAVGKSGRKRISENIVEEIESAFSWPRGWLDNETILPPREATDIRRINLSTWVAANLIPIGARLFVTEHMQGASLDKAAARRLERSCDMEEGYLDQPIADAMALPEPPPAQALRAAGKPVVGDGAYYAEYRNGGPCVDQERMIFDSPEFEHLCSAYTHGSRDRRKAIFDVAELPEQRILVTLDWLRSCTTGIAARQDRPISCAVGDLSLLAIQHPQIAYLSICNPEHKTNILSSRKVETERPSATGSRQPECDAMMHDFLSNNRDDLINRCRAKVARRPLRAATDLQLQNGVPLFLDQLIQTLRVEQTDEPMDSRRISGPDSGETSFSVMGTTAAQHGRQLLELGFSVDQVVHDYGDLCQAITDLAYERDAPFEIDEFRTLNRCLDNAIADAVTEFSYQHDAASSASYALETNERIGFLAHELRNSLQTAMFAFTAGKTGNLSFSGATGSVLDRSLMRLRDLIDQSLADVRLNSGVAAPLQLFSLADFIADIKATAELAARARECDFTVSNIDAKLAVSANRDLLFSALGNLLQNAFKFTHHGTLVTLDAYALADRILIDVKDHCGGLNTDDVETMFQPFRQNGVDRTGLGLGLSIARRSVEASAGKLSVRDLPGVGCVFTISLPRYALCDA
jgi:signal transduction histidine kinase